MFGTVYSTKCLSRPTVYRPTVDDAYLYMFVYGMSESLDQPFLIFF